MIVYLETLMDTIRPVLFTVRPLNDLIFRICKKFKGRITVGIYVIVKCEDSRHVRR